MASAKKIRGVLGLAGLAFGAFGAVRELRAAKGKSDRLAMVNALVNILAVITGAALTVRSLRAGDESAVESTGGAA